MHDAGASAYNAGMAVNTASELDAHLSAGGLVVTSSDRAARAVLRACHAARQREGRTAWPAPAVLPWQAFVRTEWEERTRDPRLVLSPQQELALWERILGASDQPSAYLDAPRRRMSALAMQAHELVCAYAPQYLDPRKRAGWDRDGETWGGWLAQFEALCRESHALSADRLALELVPLLEAHAERPPLLLAGFDRLTPAQRNLLDAWGAWRHAAASPPAENVAFYRAADARAELAACAAWCRQILDAAPDRRVLVIAQNAADRRGEIERAFLRENERGAALRFEFSLGIPLASVPVARSAEMLLRWLEGALEEQELDWLIASGHATASERETAELAAAIRLVRRRKRQRTQWTLRTFLRDAAPLPPAWVHRASAAQDQLLAASNCERSPIEWAEAASHFLQSAGWPGARAQSSAGFQAARRWNQVLEACGSLGFDGRLMRWSEFLRELRAALSETLFAPESEDAPILIAGPAESAGLSADAIWFLGADENAWPPPGDPHPLLPPWLQREAAMPHATAALDWEIAQAVTNRVLRSAPEVRFSYAAQADGTDARPSRLAKQAAGAPQEMPGELAPASATAPMATQFVDASLLAFARGDADPAATVRGGAAIINAQSRCPFQAFATVRLGAESWEPANVGLSAAERGVLVHAVMHAVWAGPPDGLRSLTDLQAVANLVEFVQKHVRKAMDETTPRHVREQMPPAYLALEEQRLNRLIVAWLEFERTRADFTVEKTEDEKHVSIEGLPLTLRLDRLDRLCDEEGSVLIIDYKTGDVSERAWDPPRPEDLQLPVYAAFGRDEDEQLGGLVFAKIRPGEICFAGRVSDAATTLLPDLGARCALIKRPFEAEQLDVWHDEIEKLARAFLAGRADVDPRDAKTCERCGLHALCRIQERESAFDEAESEESADA